MATVVQAIRLALHVGETRLGVTDIFGEDVGPPLGGVFTCTQGLRTAWNSPLDERGIVGTAIGLALAGQRPVAEIQFCDYAFNAIDLMKLAGGICWSSGGDYNCPMVLMTPVGSGIRGSLYHSHSFDGQATRLPGWKIVMPSNPLDAPLGDRSKWRPEWPDVKDLFIPIGKARTCREGKHVSVITYGRMVPMAMQAAEQLAGEGIQAEVIDLRSLHPVDWEAIEASVRKTNRVLFLNEDTEVTNFGEHLLRRTVETLFYELHAPPKLVAGAHVPGVGLADNLERASVPQLEQVVAAMRELAGHQA